MHEESLLQKYKLSTLEEVKSKWTTVKDYYRTLLHSLKKSGASAAGN